MRNHSAQSMSWFLSVPSVPHWDSWTITGATCLSAGCPHRWSWGGLAGSAGRCQAQASRSLSSLSWKRSRLGSSKCAGWRLRSRSLPPCTHWPRANRLWRCLQDQPFPQRSVGVTLWFGRYLLAVLSHNRQLHKICPQSKSLKVYQVPKFVNNSSTYDWAWYFRWIIEVELQL